MHNSNVSVNPVAPTETIAPFPLGLLPSPSDFSGTQLSFLTVPEVLAAVEPFGFLFLLFHGCQSSESSHLNIDEPLSTW